MNLNEVGIIGFGRFGALLADILCNDFQVYCYDIKANIQSNNKNIIFSPLEKVAKCDLLFFSVPIVFFEKSIRNVIPYISDDTIVLDVLSVKSYSYRIMSKYLPKHIQILPTHPMFGPDSVKNGIKGLPFILCPVDETSDVTLNFIREYLKRLGFKVIEMSCEEHDKITAYSLCTTQLIGRIMDGIGIKHSDIGTENFKNLLKMKETAINDSFELFAGLQIYNPFAKEMREKLKHEMENIEILLDNKRQELTMENVDDVY